MVSGKVVTEVVEMRRLLSKRTFGLICAGLLVFFLTAQISIFQVTLHVGDSGVTFSLRQQTTVRIFNEAHTFLNGRSYKLYISQVIIVLWHYTIGIDTFVPSEVRGL